MRFDGVSRGSVAGRRRGVRAVTARRVGSCVVAAAAALLGGPAPFRAAAADDGTPPIVVGTGDRLSGRLDAVWIGPADAPFAASLERVAAAARARGLRLQVRRAAGADAASRAVVVAAAVPCSGEVAAVLGEILRERRALVVLVGDVRAAREQFAWPDDVPYGVSSGRLRPDPRASRDPAAAAPVLWLGRGDEVAAVVTGTRPESDGRDLDGIALDAVRHAILAADGRWYLPSAIGPVRATESGGRLRIDAAPSIPGKLTIDIVDLDGRVLAVPSSGEFDLGGITEPGSAVLRVRFEGDGVADVRSFRLADRIAGRVESLSVSGPAVLEAGSAPRFAAVATRADGSPAAGCTIEAEFAGTTVTAVTDATGASCLAFPAGAARAGSESALTVTVRDRWSVSRTVRRSVTVEAPVTMRVVTDRARYRPGDVVRGALLEHRSVGGDANVAIVDPRGRVVRTFSARADESGCVPFELPLTVPTTCGRWTVAALRGGAEVRSGFDVEDPQREPFDVRVRSAIVRDAQDASAPRRATGTVSACDWGGLPAGDVRVEIRCGEASATVAGTGEIPFEIELPSETGLDGRATIDVTVSRGSDVVTATAQVRDPSVEPPLRIVAPAHAVTGLPCEVRVLAGAEAEGRIVDVVLGADRCLVATGHARIEHGAATVTFEIPDDFRGGECAVTARVRDSAVSASAPIVVSALRVSAGTDPLVAPGSAATLDVRVTDSTGRAAAAALAVSGIDAAVATGDPSAARAVQAPDAVLASSSRGAMSDDAAEFLDRARRVAFRLLREAAARGASGVAAAPWGAPVVCTESEVVVELPDAGGDGTRRTVRQPRSDVTHAEERANDPFLPFEAARWGILGGVSAWWPLRLQRPDGRWSPRDADAQLAPVAAAAADGSEGWDVGGTASVLLALLGAGETHQWGWAKENVRAGLEWLRSQQGDDGFVGPRGHPAAVLQHALATMALVEAYGMTGSRRFVKSAADAVAALAACQRSDGSFAEPSMARGSVVAGLVAAMAMKSASLAEVPVPAGVVDRHVAWVRGATEPSLGGPLPTAEETDVYALGRTRGPRLAAASAALVRMFAGELSAVSDEYRRIVRRVCADPPRVRGEAGEAGEDGFSVWAGTLAVHQLGGRRWSSTDASPWRAWSDALQRTVGSDEDAELCRSAPRPVGGLLAEAFRTMTLEVYFRYSGVLGDDVAGAAEQRVRSNFPDVCVAAAGLVTGADGTTSVPFEVPDSMTTWDLGVRAWDADGRFGVGRTRAVASIPLSVDARLPARLVVGDVVTVPVTVRSTRETATDCTLTVTRHDGCEIVAEPARAIAVPGGSTAPTSMRVRVTGGDAVVLGLAVQGGDLADAVEVRSRCVSADPRRSIAVAVAAGEDVRVEGAVPGSRATLRVFRDAAGWSRASVESLVRRPTGCFEQTCATLGPAALAARWAAIPPSDPRIAVLRDGAQRLMTFESKEGGFRLWPHGDAPPRADLTALGIHVLLDLAPYVGPDAEVLRRAGAALEQKIPAQGAESIYALGALRRVGRSDLPPPPPLGDDPYLLGLALCEDLLGAQEVRDAVRRIERAADTTVAGRATWRSAATALFSMRPVTDVECTAVVVEALARHDGDAALVASGIATLRRFVGDDGAWSTTRETVASLRAMLATDARSASSRVVCVIDGKREIPVPSGVDAADLDLGAWEATSTVRLRVDGAGRPGAILIVRVPAGAAGESDRTASHVDANPALRLDVTWPRDVVRVGADVSVPVSIVSAVPGETVESPLVVVPIPAGLACDPASLRRAVAASDFDFAEVADGEVRLYASRLRAGARMIVAVPFRARFDGSFRAPPATATPYYEPTRACSVPPATIEVVAPAR